MDQNLDPQEVLNSVLEAHNLAAIVTFTPEPNGPTPALCWQGDGSLWAIENNTPRRVGIGESVAFFRKHYRESESQNITNALFDQWLAAVEKLATPMGAPEASLQRKIESDGRHSVFQCQVNPFALAMDRAGRCFAYVERYNGQETTELSIEEALRLYATGQHYSDDSTQGEALGRFLSAAASKIETDAARKAAPAAPDWLKLGDRALRGWSEVGMEIKVPLLFKEWAILIEGAAKNRVSVGEAIAYVIRTGQDSVNWSSNGFPMERDGSKSEFKPN